MHEQLTNFENYGPYRELVETGEMTVIVTNINKSNYNDYFYGLLNILRDGIELEEVQSMFLNVVFKPGVSCKLSIMDMLFNVLMWYVLIRTDQRIKPKHLFFDEALTGASSKNYIDRYLIDVQKKKIPYKELNNIIDDTLVKFKHIEEFSFYLADTINLEDTIALMKACPEFNELMRFDYSNIPLEDVKDVGTKNATRCIEIIKDSKKYLGYEHCLANGFRSREATNEKQFREFNNVIATKPDGVGGIFPIAITQSFITGGVFDLIPYFLESSSARTAQILSKINVGTSGHFARLLGLNTQDSYLHGDPNYSCDTKNFEVITITSQKMLNLLVHKYYRLTPDGVERCISRRDSHLIGQTVYLRSPMTCASAARGEGVCHRCYGDLAWTNTDINIGKIAAELLSSKLTQRMLSAKHLLETIINKIVWNPAFFDFFEVESNIVVLHEEVSTKNAKLLIDPNSISLESDEPDDTLTYDGSEDNSFSYGDYSTSSLSADEEDSNINFLSSYNEYITTCFIETEDGEVFEITSESKEKLYITNELNSIIRRKAFPDDEMIAIPLKELRPKEGEIIPIFLLNIMNNDLTKTLDSLKEVINKKDVTESFDRNEILQKFMEIIIDGGLDLNITHAEIILMNQIRSVEDILDVPSWEFPSEPSRVIALSKALNNNPSVTNSLSYERIGRALYNPLTYRKNKPSFMDLFFMVQPQEYLNNSNIVDAVEETDVEQPMKDIIRMRPKTRHGDNIED